MLKTCLNPDCKKENRQFNARRSSTKYCSHECSNEHHPSHLRKASLGGPQSSLESKLPDYEIPVTQKPEPMKKEQIQDDEDEVKVPKRQPIPLPQNMDFATQLAFSMMQRELDRSEREALEFKKKAKNRRIELEKTRTELAELKTEQRINQIETENKKPSGLQGFTDSFKGLLDNQYIGPVVAQFLQGMMPGGMTGLPQQAGAEGGDPEAQQALVDIFNWFAVQDKPVQMQFKELVDALNSNDKVRIPDLITRLLNVLKQGSSLVKSSATGTMGF